MKKRTLQSLILGIAIGVAVGLGVYTFVYAKGASYLMNDPASCANCHIMNEQVETISADICSRSERRKEVP